ncbi:hypothetical protein [Streptomyces antibioticus]|uniref:hypothetical protein n=1 Tax=Streptomyces antibioticus TaxID=1890 RepID=UPI0036DEE00F
MRSPLTAAIPVSAVPAYDILPPRSSRQADPGDEVPFWALAWDPPAASVYSRTAKAHEALAATTRPADTYARIVALDLVAGAEMHLKRGNTEQACATWHRAIDHTDGVRSGRTCNAVSRMRGDLARFRARGLRCVTELDERGRDFLSSV